MLFKPLVVAYNILFIFSMLDQNQWYDIYTYYVLSADCIRGCVRRKVGNAKIFRRDFEVFSRSLHRLSLILSCIERERIYCISPGLIYLKVTDFDVELFLRLEPEMSQRVMLYCQSSRYSIIGKKSNYVIRLFEK